jgi:inner membrane protein
MDTLTHALSGALLARATAPAELPRSDLLRRVAAGFLACAAPDLDFVVGFLGPVRYLELHRGVSHSLLLLPAWAWLLSWLLALLLRERRGWRALYGVTAMSLGAHIAGDVITSFGTMVFAPLSDWRVALGTTFIIDLWFTGIIVAGLVATLAASLMGRGSRMPARAAGVVLLAYVGLQGVLKQQALDVARAHAATLGLRDAAVRADPRPVSPFNWTLFVSDAQAHRHAHVNLRRDAPRVAPPDAGLVARLDAPYRPVAQAEWQEHTRYGPPDVTPLAMQAWQSPALAFFRWFAAVPAYDGITAGSTCVWFVDLRFMTPGRGEMPFRFGACRDGNGPWRPHERTSDATSRPLD